MGRSRDTAARQMATHVAICHRRRTTEDVMPRSWTEKDERKYEHIKEGARKRGSSTRRAKAIAARTVNKGRRQEGRTANRRTLGTGNPRKSLADRSRDELMNRARKLGISGTSRMRKQELVRA